jgi:hypothetical protein
MNEMNIPTLAYVFVGITALMISYMTLMEEPEQIETVQPSNATSMLPNIFGGPKPQENAPPQVNPVQPVEPQSMGIIPNINIPGITNEPPQKQPILGGKKNKTKRAVSTHTKTKSKR